MLEGIFSHNAQDLEFFEQGLSLVDACLTKMPTVTPRQWYIFELICNAVLHFAPDFIEEVFMTFDSFMVKDMNGILQGNPAKNVSYVNLMWQVHQKMIDDMSETEQAWSSRILLSLLLRTMETGSFDAFLPSMLTSVVRQATSRKTGDARIALTSVIGGCFINHAALAIQTLQNENLFGAVADLLLHSPEHDLSRLDKKTIALGILALLRELPEQLLSAEQAVRMMTVVVTLLHQRHASMLGQEEDSDEDEEDSDEDEEFDEEEEDEEGDGPVVIGEDDDVIDEEDEEYMKVLQVRVWSTCACF